MHRRVFCSWLLLSQLPPARTLENVANFRQVSPSLPGIYRSAALEQATAADVAMLLDGARIRTIVDLRNEDEVEKAWAGATPFGRALRKLYDSNAAVGAGCAASEGGGELCRLHVPLLRDTDAFLEEVATRLSPARKAEAMLARTFDGRRYDQLLYDEVARRGQVGLYTVMLRTSDEIGHALRVVAERRQSGGVLIHCAKGKDRTGVLAALLQHSMGDAEEAIVSEYAQSEALLSKEAHTAGPSDEGGVDWGRLAGSPPEAMTSTLAWVREQHGSIDSFLCSSLGGDKAAFEAWRQALHAAVRLRA